MGPQQAAGGINNAVIFYTMWTPTTTNRNTHTRTHKLQVQ